MGEELIWVAIITTAGGILGLLLLDRNWFRRETFKLNRDFRKKEYDLKFKKMARDMGLEPSRKMSPPPNLSSPAPLDTMGIIAPFLKSLAPEQIRDLIGVITGQPAEAGEEDDYSDLIPGGIAPLLEFARTNPAIVSGILEGLKNKTPPGGTTGF